MPASQIGTQNTEALDGVRVSSEGSAEKPSRGDANAKSGKFESPASKALSRRSYSLVIVLE